MSNYIIDTTLSYWKTGRRVKNTPSGWISGNAPCCIHNNNSPDTRGRGGFKIQNDVISWHCFNCGYTATWQQGRQLNYKFRNILDWIGVPRDAINKCAFEAMRTKSGDPIIIEERAEFLQVELPINTKPIREWVNIPDERIIPVLDYMNQRGLYLDDYDWHWSPEPKWVNRLIIPFTYKSKVVGYTARAIEQTATPKYISSQQPGFVFNLDNQVYNRKYVIVAEGPFDAIAVDGVAILHNTISHTQRNLINNLYKEVIVVPDKDSGGKTLFESAMANGWNVSLPVWPDPDIKDLSDAARLYGQIYTLYTVLQHYTANPVKAKVIAKKWFNV